MSNIPSNINKVYSLLSEEVMSLYGRWICFRQLFAKSEQRIEMLNECASTFFYIAQNMFFDEIQVSLSKLTDPAKTGKTNENLSLDQLQLMLEQYGEAVLAQSNRKKLDEIHIKVEPFRVWRNKWLAHLDLNTASKATFSNLPGVSLQMIDESLRLIAEYLNSIELHYNISAIGYEYFEMMNDGESLLQIIRYGLRYKQLLEDGSISRADLRNGEWYGV